MLATYDPSTSVRLWIIQTVVCELPHRGCKLRLTPQILRTQVCSVDLCAALPHSKLGRLPTNEHVSHPEHVEVDVSRASNTTTNLIDICGIGSGLLDVALVQGHVLLQFPASPFVFSTAWSVLLDRSL